MTEVVRTPQFHEWLSKLKDRQGATRIAMRIDRLVSGNAGDVKSIGGGITEMRVDCGPGYRVYFTRRGGGKLVLLCGGDKRTQDRDIALAKVFATLY